MAKILVQDIVKQFGETTAINHVSLEIADGEFMVLLGPSGCGKTTTLRSIAGLETIDTGEIWIGDRPMNGRRPSERDIAFCFQHYALYPHLSAYDNIAFPLRTQKVSRDEIKKQVDDVAEVLGIHHILRKKPKHLSGGDQQRVALARAMVRQPMAFLMDEPMGTLDAKLRESMRVELRRMQTETKSTTVYVTHDQVEAMSMADRVAIMNKGRLLQVDSPQEIYDHPNCLFVANFIGSPGMNLIPCHWRRDAMSCRLDFGPDTEDLALPPGYHRYLAQADDGLAMFMGVRPEDIQVGSAPGPGSFAVELMLIEPIGAENLLTLRRGNTLLKARVNPDREWPLGTKLWMACEERGLHLFERRTEQAIF